MNKRTKVSKLATKLQNATFRR